MNHLLTLCARPQPDPAYFPQLIDQAEKITDWTTVPAQAEWQGLGPLLYTHLKAAKVSVPQAARRELPMLYLRHRHANGVRARVLAEILAAYEATGIRTLVLKGAALAHLLYPEPALRPMSDVDLLVRKSEAHQAQQLLTKLGFRAPVPLPNQLPGKHLPLATRVEEGLIISVELHHNLFNIGTPASLELEDLSGPPLPFALEGVTAYTLPHEEMLWHLCRHLTLIGQPFRLIWLADIVGLAERFVAEIDWARVEQRYPLVLSTLSLFHFITPLSAALRQTAPLKIGRAPQGIGQQFEGWPAASIKRQRAAGKGYGRILGETLCPSDWWLRLYYGLGSARPVFWHQWVVHPVQIGRWAGQLLFERLGWRTPPAELQIGV